MKNKWFKILICAIVAISCFVILSAFTSKDKRACPKMDECTMTECPKMGGCGMRQECVNCK